MIALCDRWHKLPSEVLAEDASLLQLLEIARLGRTEQSEEVN